MIVEINLDPRMKKRPANFYLSLATLCASLLILAGIAAWYFLLQQELSGIRQRLTQAEEERSHIQQQLQHLHTGINESNYWFRYGQLIEELENMTPLSLYDVVLQMRNGLPAHASIQRLDITADGYIRLEAFVISKSDAGLYLDALASLPSIQSVQLHSIQQLNTGGHRAVYELSIRLRGDEE